MTITPKLGIGERNATNTGLDDIVSEAEDKGVCSVVFEIGTILFQNYKINKHGAQRKNFYLC